MPRKRRWKDHLKVVVQTRESRKQEPPRAEIHSSISFSFPDMIHSTWHEQLFFVFDRPRRQGAEARRRRSLWMRPRQRRGRQTVCRVSQHISVLIGDVHALASFLGEAGGRCGCRRDRWRMQRCVRQRQRRRRQRPRRWLGIHALPCLPCTRRLAEAPEVLHAARPVAVVGAVVASWRRAAHTAWRTPPQRQGPPQAHRRRFCLLHDMRLLSGRRPALGGGAAEHRRPWL